MLTVQQPEAVSADWVAVFDQQGLRRPQDVVSRARGLESALRVFNESTSQRASLNGNIALFDGSLFDRGELERTLGLVGANSSDAILVLQAFAHWGDDFLRHIKGLFAVVVWDSATARLIAARDHFGEYPLFFSDAGGRELLLSTSIDALLADPRVRRTLNPAALADHLCQRWPDPTETFFACVRRVPPGHRLVASAAGLKIDRYWHPVPLDGSTKWLSADDLDEFDHRLDTAVERVLAEGRSGILLSGGLDSVSVAVGATDVARRAHGPMPMAFSLAYPGPSAEEPLQRAVATSLGMQQHVVPFWDAVGQEGSLLTETLRLSQTLPILLHSPWTPAYEHLLRMAAANGLATIMTGCGGDEGFAINPLYAAEALRRGNVVAFARHLVAWRRSYNTPLSWYLRGMLWIYGVRTLGVSALERLAPTRLNRGRVRRAMEGAPSYVAPEAHLNTELARRVLKSFEAKRTEGPLHLREVTNRLEHSLESQAAEENFERGRRLGIRLRHPLRDPDLTELVYRMPQRLIYGDGRAKDPLRRRVSSRLPSLGFDRQKKLGGTGFFRSILASELPGIWRRTSLSALDRLGVVDARGATAMVNSALQSENTRNLMPVWELVKLEAWAESRI